MSAPTRDPLASEPSAPAESSPPTFAAPLAPRRQLMRSRDSRVLTGVMGGFAEYFGMDPVILRVIMVVAGLLSGGLVFVPYFLCMFIMPKRPSSLYAASYGYTQTGFDGHARNVVAGSEHWVGYGQPGQASRPGSAQAPGTPRMSPLSDMPQRQTSRSSLFAAIAIGFGLLGLSDMLGISLDGGFLWPLAFIGFGVAVLWSRQNSKHLPDDVGHQFAGVPSSSPAFGSSFSETGFPDPDPYDPRAYQYAQPVGQPLQQPFAQMPSSPQTVPAPAPRRRRSRVQTRYSRGAPAVYMIIVGAAMVLGRSSAVDSFNLRTGSAFALTVLGVVVLLGSWLGRPKLLTVGVLLTLFLAFVSVVGLNFGHGVGQRVATIASPVEIVPQKLDAGEVTFDLRKFSPGDIKTMKPLDAKVSLGVVRVVLPAGVSVRTHAKVSGGEVLLNGVSQASGVDVNLRDTFAAPEPVRAKAAAIAKASTGGAASPANSTTPTVLDLNVDIGFGSLQIDFPDPAKANLSIAELYPSVNEFSDTPLTGKP